MRWLRKGLKFACTQCGVCCAIPEREVWINRQEILKLTEALGIDVSTFLSRYTDGNQDAKFRLKKGADSKSCVFLDANRRCSVHKHRPLQETTEGGISESAIVKDMMRTDLHRESEDFDHDVFEEFLEISDDQPLEEYAEQFWKRNYRRVRYQKENVMVVDTYLNGEDPKRSLVFTSMPSHDGVWKPCHGRLLQRPYQAMILPLASRLLHKQPDDKPIKIAILGAGCGALANFLHSTTTLPIQVDAVDIDRLVLEVGATWFDFQEQPNLKIVCADAFEFLQTSECYDCIFLDIPSAKPQVEAPAADFCQDDVIRFINRRLSPGGSVVVNIVGGLSKLSAVHRCFRHHFHSTEALHLPDATVYYAHTSIPPPAPTLAEIQAMSDSKKEACLFALLDVLRSIEAHSVRFHKLSMGWLSASSLESL